MTRNNFKFNLPVILIPPYLSLKNFLIKHAWQRETLIRLIIGSIITFLLMLSIFKGGFLFLEEVKKGESIIHVSSTLILNLLFTSLLLLLFFTNLFQAINQLYASKDLEMLHKSPISPKSFFVGNFIKTYLQTSWMSLIFILPIFAFLIESGNVYEYNFLFNLIIIAIFFSIPTSIAYIAASIYPIVLPNRYAKIISKLLMVIIGIILFRSLLLLSSEIRPYDGINSEDIKTLLPLISLINNPNLPTFWTARLLDNSLGLHQYPILTDFILLVSLVIFLTCSSYILLRTFYKKSYSLYRSESFPAISSSKEREKRARAFLYKLSHIHRAFLLKDIRLFTRNIGQAGQLIMISLLITAYLYIINFQLEYIQQLDPLKKTWWINALSVSNSCLEAFITLAFGTRVIYPQWSYEGKCLWIIKSCPIPLEKIFKAKVYTWYFPTTLLLSSIFTMTLIALNASFFIICLKFIFTAITCYTLICLGIGLSAYFSDFSNENPADVTSGFGSLIFMLISFIIILINLILETALFSSGGLSFLAFDTSKDITFGKTSLLIVLIILLVNLSAAKLSLKLGRERILS